MEIEFLDMFEQELLPSGVISDIEFATMELQISSGGQAAQPSAVAYVG